MAHRTRSRALLATFALVLLGVAPTGPALGADVAAACRSWDDRAACRWAGDLLDRMTIEEKVGQLFVTYAYGETVDTTNASDVAANRSWVGVDNGAQLIEKYKPGGIIYFTWTRSLNNPAQIARLSNGIQRSAAAQRVPVPMQISTDQEGGSVVVRVGPPATQLPGNMALGANGGVIDAALTGWIAGRELRAMGINQNYAPDADVNVNPANPVIGVRSFSSDPRLAARLTMAQVAGYEQGGVSATAKHFPGHGDTNVDSHTGIPVISHTRAEWERIDRPPFESAIRAGIDAIMTAHIVVPSLDPSGDPATLSKPILTGILRDELHYDGVVVTDSLGMAGVRQKYGDDRVPVLALQAGVDQLLMPPNLDLAYNSVLAAVRGGELTEARIDQSVLRILRLKYQRGLARNAFVDETRVSSVVGAPPHVALVQHVTDHSITLVKNDGGLLPLAANSGRKILVTGWGAATTATLADNLDRRGVTADALETGLAPTQAQIDAAVAAARTRELVVVTTNRVGTNAAQVRLVAALQATAVPVVVVAIRDPYDIGYFPSVPAYLATYSYTAASLDSLARVLFGEVNPTGHLPVTIPVAGDPATELYPLGHGLSYGG
jgi:beta-N-acetylhexosaminidase